jgi:hypothetical protein
MNPICGSKKAKERKNQIFAEIPLPVAPIKDSWLYLSIFPVEGKWSRAWPEDPLDSRPTIHIEDVSPRIPWH